MSPDTAIHPTKNASPRTVKAPELLAPAGDWECAKAAVENGADAIYFGLERFNARMRAHNFTAADLPELMAFLHHRGVRGYVTFNTLVFTDEMDDAAQYLHSIIAAGVDAAIVQDIGICRLIRRLSPDFPIHGSTQMTVTSNAGIEFTKELGCQLVVLARECSLKEIEKMQQAQAAAPVALPLEVFVHGALCVAYSGQCLTSESLGGRSANRGECAQACRLPYDLIADGKVVDLGDRRYLLSPQDLSGVEVLPDLIRLGLTSLKIEGRLKSPEYVANITRVYRSAIDRLTETAAQNPQTLEAQSKNIAESTRYPLEMGFSRGLYTGWFRGINNQELAHARFGKKRGVYLGRVERIQNGGVWLKLEGALKAGDGVVFDAGHPDTKEEGGRVYKVIPKSPLTFVEFGRQDVNWSHVQPGDRLWKTNDPELDRELRQTFSGDKPRIQRPVVMEVHGTAGKPMTLILQDELGNSVQAQSTVLLSPAENQPLTDDRLREQLGRLGGTPFRLQTLKNVLPPGLMLPMSALNQLRRDAVAQLEERRRAPKRWTLNALTEEPVTAISRSATQPQTNPTDAAELLVLVRKLDQLEAILPLGLKTIYCELEDPKKYPEITARVQTYRATHGTGPRLFAAPPRITKMGEEWILKQVRASNADGYLIRNYDHLNFFADVPRVGDFSLNVANPLTAEYFMEKFGLERLTASYDLNISQLEGLLKGAPPAWFEITLHQHMPMFHMEHCVFCAFLTQGTDFTNCGRPCEKQDVKIRDRMGLDHPLKADAGCRNTVYNARAQTGAEFADHLMKLGARRFRIEFVNESPGEVLKTIDSYQQLLAGKMRGADLWKNLKLHNQLGVTRGQLEKPA